MISVRLICVGKLKEKFYVSACSEYCKRLMPYARVDVQEIAEERMPDDPSPAEMAQCLKKEGQAILRAIVPGSFVTALCIEGTLCSSEALAREIDRQAVSGVSKFAFIIGGSCGLSDAVKERADLRLSMSPMTFPHHLARVMLLEQLYRAFQISGGGKYHK